ncbi:hypothetical protein VTN00DRAFT_4762 [Thermoascus crustaceus]|uniref:uncharacterized protein n=1 Tax=Thermoascus crustaceus TaxID=5088 RepID=UPI0037421DED
MRNKIWVSQRMRDLGRTRDSRTRAGDSRCAAFRAEPASDSKLPTLGHFDETRTILPYPLPYPPPSPSSPSPYRHPSQWLTFFRKNATFLTTVFAGAFFAEIAWDNVTDKIWDQMNQGRQWKDIRHKYIQKAEEEE